jgi:hypothetical protein
VPLWIAAYRYGDRVYRFVVNGQTGAHHGTRPLSWWRVGAALLVAAAAIAGILFLVTRGG